MSGLKTGDTEIIKEVPESFLSMDDKTADEI